MKRLLAVCFVAAMAMPLAACFEDLSDSVERLAGIPGQAVMDEIDQGLAAAEPQVQADIDAWVDGHEAALTLLPNGSSCQDSNECQSNHCENNTCS